MSVSTITMGLSAIAVCICSPQLLSVSPLLCVCFHHCCVYMTTILQIPLSPWHLTTFQLFILPGEERFVGLWYLSLWTMKNIPLEKLVFKFRGNTGQQVLQRLPINSGMYDVLKVYLSSHLIIQKDFFLEIAENSSVQHRKCCSIHNVPNMHSFNFLIIFKSLAVLSLHCFAWTFSNCSRQGLLSSFSAQAPLQQLLLLQSTGSRVRGLQQLWLVHLVAPWHMQSSQTRDPTCVFCIGRWILNPQTIRKSNMHIFYSNKMRETNHQIDDCKIRRWVSNIQLNIYRLR